MNATSLYVSTCRLVLQANAEDSASWTDLFRLVPYLRQSLSCTVCGNLLIEPYTPTETNCQHHVCKACKGGKKKLKPSCSWCKDYDKYVENVQLRILLQCYKKLCEYVTSTSIFKKLANTSLPSSNNVNTNLLDGSTPSLISLIQEGAGFADEFRSSGTARSNFALSCVYTNTTSTQTNSASASVSQPEDLSSLSSPNGGDPEITKPLQNGSSVYSVLFAGSGNKLTIKRKATDPVGDIQDNPAIIQSNVVLPPPPPLLKAPVSHVQTPTTNSTPPAKKLTRGGKSSLAGNNIKIGCRCGNATATPGKLTCCGQRCACYTDSKPCVDCKCRGCRNPHTADGLKVCPILTNYGLTVTGGEGTAPQCISLGSNDIATTAGGTVQVVGVYTTQLHNAASGSLLLDANTTVTTCEDDLDVHL